MSAALFALTCPPARLVSSCPSPLQLPFKQKMKKFEVSTQTDTDANICHIIFPRPMRSTGHMRSLCMRMLFIYHGTVLHFLWEPRHRKKVNANVDLLPLCCACLATAACLLLMSVNTFSESALGILSKRTKHVTYEQVKKTFDFSCDALKWTVIKLWWVTAELARYSRFGLNNSRCSLKEPKWHAGVTKAACDQTKLMTPEFRGSTSGRRSRLCSLPGNHSNQTINKWKMVRFRCDEPDCGEVFAFGPLQKLLVLGDLLVQVPDHLAWTLLARSLARVSGRCSSFGLRRLSASRLAIRRALLLLLLLLPPAVGLFRTGFLVVWSREVWHVKVRHLHGNQVLLRELGCHVDLAKILSNVSQNLLDLLLLSLLLLLWVSVCAARLLFLLILSCEWGTFSC